MKTVFNTRNVINLSLIMTLGFGPALTYVRASDVGSDRSSDLVLASLQAKKSGNIADYQTYLRRAKANLSSEMMTPSAQANTGMMIDKLIADTQPLPQVASTGDAQADLLQADPQARAVLYSMAFGRSKNISARMNVIMKQITGTTGPQYDVTNDDTATLDAWNPTADLVAKVFALIGVTQSNEAYNLSVIRRNDPNWNPDVVANNLVNANAKKMALELGSASAFASVLKQTIPNKYIQAAGLTTSGLIFLRNNAQMMQDIAALYGQPIRSANDFEAYSLSVFFLAQMMSRVSENVTSKLFTAPATTPAQAQVGANLALLKSPQWAAKARGFFARLMKTPEAQGLAGGKLGTDKLAAMTGIPVDPTVPTAPAPVPAPGPVAPTGGAVDTNPNASVPVKNLPHRAALQAVVSIGVKTIIDASTAFGLTEAVGHAAIGVARSAAKKSQEMRDKAFYAFMESSYGQDYVNLLLMASQASNNPVRDVDLEKSADPRVAFIRNVAHMGHICSATDIARANLTLRQQGPKTQDFLAFECGGAGRSAVAFSVVRQNFLNFKSIMSNDQQMVALRKTSKSNRLKMLQQLNQFQLLGDNYRDNKELDFFETARKLVGLEDGKFDNYFQEYDSHVMMSHGPKASSASPTGFIVTAAPQAAPFSEKAAGINPNDAEILDSDILDPNAAGAPTPLNTNTTTTTATSTSTDPNNQSGNAGDNGTWPPNSNLPPTTPIGPACNPNAPGCVNNPDTGGGTTTTNDGKRSWISIDPKSVTGG